MGGHSITHPSNSPPHQYMNHVRNSSKILILPILYITMVLEYQEEWNVIFIRKYFRIFFRLLFRGLIVPLPTTEYTIGPSTLFIFVL